MAALALARAIMNDPSDPADATEVPEARGPRDAAGLEDEVAQLRQLIRMIGHEVGNSLGPIGSLLGSARVILSRQAPSPDLGGASGAGAPPVAPAAAGRAPAEVLALARLDLVLRTAAERAGHLQSFLSECVRLTRLPDPNPVPADWGVVTDRLRALWPGLSVELPAGHLKATFDVSQIEQVLVNLVKNAYESGGPSDEVRVCVERVAGGGGGGTRVTVLDRGRGASDLELEAMSRGGFTTKRGAGGVGLGVCRTLIERHGGRLRLERRSGGRGLAVSFWLP